jgi:hypothetical protein
MVRATGVTFQRSIPGGGASSWYPLASLTSQGPRSVDVAIVGDGSAALAAYDSAIARTPSVSLIGHGAPEHQAGLHRRR